MHSEMTPSPTAVFIKALFHGWKTWMENKTVPGTLWELQELMLWESRTGYSYQMI